MRSYWARLSNREKYLAVAIPIGLLLIAAGFAELVGLLHVPGEWALLLMGLAFMLWLEFIRPERWLR